MNKQLIAIDPSALDSLRMEIIRLHRRLDTVTMAPRPEWVTVDTFASMIGKHRRTVLRRIAEGKVETREIGGERMVRVNQGA